MPKHEGLAPERSHDIRFGSDIANRILDCLDLNQAVLAKRALARRSPREVQEERRIENDS